MTYAHKVGWRLVRFNGERIDDMDSYKAVVDAYREGAIEAFPVKLTLQKNNDGIAMMVQVRRTHTCDL